VTTAEGCFATVVFVVLLALLAYLWLKRREREL
jgi:hypothetical protein